MASQGIPKHLVALDDISIQLEQRNSTATILGQEEPEADIEDEVRDHSQTTTMRS